MINLKEHKEPINAIRGCQVLTYSNEVLKKEVIRYRKGQRWKSVDEELTLRYGHEYTKKTGVVVSVNVWQHTTHIGNNFSGYCVGIEVNGLFREKICE